MLKIAFSYMILHCVSYLTCAQNCSELVKYSEKEGIIKGPIPIQNSYIELNVTYTYSRRYRQQLEGRLFPLYSADFIHEFLDTPVIYMIKFPLENPTVIKITANGKTLCAEVETYPLSGTTRTTSHRMTIYGNNPTKPTTSQKVSEICGLEIDKAAITPFVYGGTTLRRGQFPWLTAIYEKTAEGLKFLCGGSLITSRLIISAAHCFTIRRLAAGQIMVFLGRHNLTNYIEDHMVLRDIKELHIHPDYSDSHDADLALLTLATPVNFTDYIRPICLWTGPSDMHLITGSSGVVAGWGSNEIGHTVSQVPKSVDVTIVSNESCIRSSPVFLTLTSERTFCAGRRDDTGPCKGDSGGGLVIYQNGRWILRGIVSSGLTRAQRCDLQEYVVYCDVAKHMEWIRSI